MVAEGTGLSCGDLVLVSSVLTHLTHPELVIYQRAPRHNARRELGVTVGAYRHPGEERFGTITETENYTKLVYKLYTDHNLRIFLKYSQENLYHYPSVLKGVFLKQGLFYIRIIKILSI